MYVISGNTYVNTISFMNGQNASKDQLITCGVDGVLGDSIIVSGVQNGW